MIHIMESISAKLRSPFRNPCLAGKVYEIDVTQSFTK